MCGIGGFCLNPKDHKRIDADQLAGALLLGLEQRGRHATGSAWREGGTVVVRKDAVPASTWVKRGVHKCAATTRILHTRYATQGSPDNPLNNHPIRQGQIVGTHNGMLEHGQDDDIFTALGGGVNRFGQVDSEAIFALLAHVDAPVIDVLKVLRGRVALAWFDEADSGDVLHLARVNESPLAIGQTANGSLIYASTMPILNAACKHAGVRLTWRHVVPEATYMRVRNGVILSTESFGAPTRVPVFSSGRNARYQSDGASEVPSRRVYTPRDWDWDDIDDLTVEEWTALLEGSES